MIQTMYSLGDVSKQVGVAPFTIAYAIPTGRLPDPEFRFAGKRVFTNEDLRRIKEHFGAKAEAAK